MSNKKWLIAIDSNDLSRWYNYVAIDGLEHEASFTYPPRNGNIQNIILSKFTHYDWADSYDFICEILSNMKARNIDVFWNNEHSDW